MPGKFLTPLRDEYIDGNYYRLTDDLVYAVNSDGTDLITVPKGFVTDYASVPPVARWFVPKRGKYDPAAGVHDWLYFTKTRPRSECDGIFCEAMKSLDVNWMEGEAMYLALRGFGWYAWYFGKDKYNNKALLVSHA